MKIKYLISCFIFVLFLFSCETTSVHDVETVNLVELAEEEGANSPVLQRYKASGILFVPYFLNNTLRLNSYSTVDSVSFEVNKVVLKTGNFKTLEVTDFNYNGSEFKDVSSASLLLLDEVPEDLISAIEDNRLDLILHLYVADSIAAFTTEIEYEFFHHKGNFFVVIP